MADTTTKGNAVPTGGKKNVCEICLLPSSINKFNINDGYVMGPVPVTEKIAGRWDGRTVRKSSIRSGTLQDSTEVSQEGDATLWHTLTGCVVHLTED